MAYYTVYWPQDWLDELRKSDDNGPGNLFRSHRAVLSCGPIVRSHSSVLSLGRSRLLCTQSFHNLCAR